jgi:hypothetical protein
LFTSGAIIYAYVGGNPVNAIDPLGLSHETPQSFERCQQYCATKGLTAKPITPYRFGIFHIDWCECDTDCPIDSDQNRVNSANKPYNDTGLSEAARAWDKHSPRPGSSFDPLRGNVEQKNATASEFIKKLLNDPNAVREDLSGGGVDYRLPNGQGARWNADGSFSGLLDPKR